MEFLFLKTELQLQKSHDSHVMLVYTCFTLYFHTKCSFSSCGDGTSGETSYTGQLRSCNKQTWFNWLLVNMSTHSVHPGWNPPSQLALLDWGKALLQAAVVLSQLGDHPALHHLLYSNDGEYSETGHVTITLYPGFKLVTPLLLMWAGWDLGTRLAMRLANEACFSMCNLIVVAMSCDCHVTIICQQLYTIASIVE